MSGESHTVLIVLQLFSSINVIKSFLCQYILSDSSSVFHYIIIYHNLTIYQLLKHWGYFHFSITIKKAVITIFAHLCKRHYFSMTCENKFTVKRYALFWEEYDHYCQRLHKLFLVFMKNNSPTHSYQLGQSFNVL